MCFVHRIVWTERLHSLLLLSRPNFKNIHIFVPQNVSTEQISLSISRFSLRLFILKNCLKFSWAWKLLFFCIVHQFDVLFVCLCVLSVSFSLSHMFVLQFYKCVCRLIFMFVWTNHLRMSSNKCRFEIFMLTFSEEIHRNSESISVIKN